MAVVDTPAVAAARAQLAAAEAQAREDRRKELVVMLKEKREKRAEFIAEYRQIEKTHNEYKHASAKLDYQIAVQDHAVSESLRRRPRCADYLPEDPEVTQWATQHTGLVVALDGLRAERGALQRADGLRTLKLESSIQQLDNVINNVLNELEGNPHGWVGGISAA